MFSIFSSLTQLGERLGNCSCVSAVRRFSIQLSVFVLLALPATAASPDTAFVEGLVDRRLFTLAETFCRQQLASQPSEVEQAELAIALCRTYAQHALNSPREERVRLWQAAGQAAADFSRTHPESAQRVLVDMQQALTLLARGELARQEAEVGAPGAPSLDEARRELSRAIAELDHTAGTIERQLRTAKLIAAEGELAEAELLSLQRNVRYQLARAYRNQALSYPADSAERADSLIQALELLGPLVELEIGDSLVWNARIDEIASLRLRGKLQDANLRLAQLAAQAPPSKVRLRAQAEKVRILLAAGRADDALDVLKDGREIAGQTSAEFDLAHVETFVTLWQQANDNLDKAAAQRWERNTANMLAAMEDLYGRYWTRRGELLLGAAVGSGGGNAGLEVLTRAAKNHFLRKEFDDAVVAYQRAAQAAEQAGQGDQALELYYAAALVERQRGNLTQSAVIQRQLALRLSRQAKAPQIHLQAVLAAAQIARDGTSASLQAYQDILAEHVETWPQEPTANRARLWAARLAEHGGDYTQALAIFQTIRPGNAEFAEAVEGVARCYHQQIKQLANADKPTEAIIREAADWFRQSIVGEDNRLPEDWSPAHRVAALHAARFQFELGQSGFTAAESLLEVALLHSEDAPAAWRSQAESLQVIAHAGAGNRDLAKQRLQQIGDGSATSQLEVLRGLSELAQTSSPQVRRELAQLQLEVVARLRQQIARLSPAQQTDLEAIDATALVAAGRRTEALARYRQLAANQPNRGDIQQTYAELLAEGDDAASAQAALKQWRKVLSRSESASSRWFHAKHGIAQAQVRLGQKQSAIQLIRLLRTLHPELGGPEMKPRFLRLLATAEE